MRSLKYIPLLALLLAACNKYDIQPEQAEGFIKFYSSSTLTETAYDVKETADGGYVAIGTTVTDEESGSRDLYLVKTDKYGNEESWSPVTIGGAYDDVGTSIQVVQDGYVILGYSKQTDTSDYDMYMVKTDLQGNTVWETWDDALSDERGMSLEVTSQGEYLAVGTRVNTTSGNNQYIVAKFDINGDCNRGQPIGYPNNNILNPYIIETQEYFVICSTLRSNQKNEIEIDVFEKDNIGIPLNHKSYYADGDLHGNCIQELEDGNLLVCGTVFDPSTGLSDIYLNKITSTLGTVPGWETYKTFTVTGDQVSLSGNAVRVVDNNSYAIVGTRTETGNDDIILLHSDAEGNEVSRRIFGDDGFQQGMSLELTGFDGGLILVGNNGSEDQSMMALVKTDASGNL